MSETREMLLAVGKALFPDRNFGNLRSYHARRATFLAAATTQLHSHVETVKRHLMPTTQPDEDLDDGWGFVKDVARKGATSARKAAAGRVSGNSGTAVTQGLELVHQSSGLRFQIATATMVPVSEVVDADIEAIDTGAQTRLLTGEVLEFVAPPPGLQTQVVLVKDLDEDGFDQEQYGSYLGRILEAFSSRKSGGSQGDYVAWAKSVEGVTYAYVYPNRAGIGSIDVVGLHAGTGATRLLDLAERNELLAYLQTKAPAPIAATNGPLRVLEVVIDAPAGGTALPLATDIEIVLTPSGESAYAFDWAGGPLTVAAWTAGTRSLQFTAPLPASMKAGHRLSLRSVGVYAGTMQDGAELTIEALSGADTVILETAPVVAPVAGDLAYSGGPLVTPIRRAILAHLNGESVFLSAGAPVPASALDSAVGLDVIAEGIGPANPDGKYGTWSGGIIRNVLSQIAMSKRGVRNLAIVSPAADVEATDDAFPNDDRIHLFAPTLVLVRGAT